MYIDSWESGWILNLTKCRASFNPSFKRPTCQATPKSCDTTKQFVRGWQYIYIYIYIVCLWIREELFSSICLTGRSPVNFYNMDWYQCFLTEGNKFFIFMWPIVGFLFWKNNLLFIIIYIKLLTRIIGIEYFLFEYLKYPAWNCSLLWIYWI